MARYYVAARLEKDYETFAPVMGPYAIKDDAESVGATLAHLPMEACIHRRFVMNTWYVATHTDLRGEGWSNEDIAQQLAFFGCSPGGSNDAQ